LAAVARALQRRGQAMRTDLVEDTGLSASQVWEALRILLRRELVTRRKARRHQRPAWRYSWRGLFDDLDLATLVAQGVIRRQDGQPASVEEVRAALDRQMCLRLAEVRHG